MPTSFAFDTSHSEEDEWTRHGGWVAVGMVSPWRSGVYG